MCEKVTYKVKSGTSIFCVFSHYSIQNFDDIPFVFHFPIKLGNSRPTVIFFNSVPYITEVSVDAISNTIKCLTFEKMPKLPFRLDELIITSKGIRCQFKPNRLL